MLVVIASDGSEEVIESIKPIAAKGGRSAIESHVPCCETIVGSKRVDDSKAPAWKKHANKIRKNDIMHDIIAPPVWFWPKIVASNVLVDVNRIANASSITSTNGTVMPLNGNTAMKCHAMPETRHDSRHTRNV